MAKISTYGNTISSISNDDLLDVSELISTGPNVYQTAKLTFTTLRAWVVANAGNIINTDGLTMPADRAHNMDGYTMTFTSNANAVWKLISENDSNAQLILANTPAVSASGNNNLITSYQMDGTTEWTVGVNGTSPTGQDLEFVIAGGNSMDTDYVIVARQNRQVMLGTNQPVDSAMNTFYRKTIVQGDSALSTGTAFAIWNEDTVDVELWNWRNNGDIYQGANSIWNLQSNSLSFDGGKLIVGSSTAIGSEDISLQGETYIQRASTSSADTILSLLDNVGTELWDWKANGDIYQGANSVHYLQGNDLTFDASVGGAISIIGNTSNNYEFFQNSLDGGTYTNKTILRTSKGSAGIQSYLDNYYENTSGTDVRLSRLMLNDSSIAHVISKTSGADTNSLTYNYVTQLHSNNQLSFSYQSRVSRSYLQRLNISGTVYSSPVSATDYWRIANNLNYIIDKDNVNGFNVGIGTDDNPAAKLTVNGDSILNGTSKIGTEDISLQGDTYIGGYLELQNGLKNLGYTSSTAAPTTTELPADKNYSIHKDTSAGTVYFAYNDGGVIKSVTLT